MADVENKVETEVAETAAETTTPATSATTQVVEFINTGIEDKSIKVNEKGNLEMTKSTWQKWMNQNGVTKEIADKYVSAQTDLVKGMYQVASDRLYDAAKAKKEAGDTDAPNTSLAFKAYTNEGSIDLKVTAIREFNNPQTPGTKTKSYNHFKVAIDYERMLKDDLCKPYEEKMKELFDGDF